jgi:phosphoserine aminotransferase
MVVVHESGFLSGVSILAILAATSEAGATMIDCSSSVVTYTVPETGAYDITAAGAQGGAGVGGRHSWRAI